MRRRRAGSSAGHLAAPGRDRPQQRQPGDRQDHASSGRCCRSPAAPNLRFDRVQNAAPYVVGPGVAAGRARFRSAIVRCTPASAASESFLCSGLGRLRQRHRHRLDLPRPVGLEARTAPSRPGPARSARSTWPAYDGRPDPPILCLERQLPERRDDRLQPTRPSSAARSASPSTARSTLTSNLGYPDRAHLSGQRFRSSTELGHGGTSDALHQRGSPAPAAPTARYGGGTVTDSGSTVTDTSDDRVYHVHGLRRHARRSRSR